MFLTLCMCVCVDCYTAAQGSMKCLICGFANAWFLTWNAIKTFSEECV